MRKPATTTERSYRLGLMHKAVLGTVLLALIVPFMRGKSGLEHDILYNAELKALELKDVPKDFVPNVIKETSQILEITRQLVNSSADKAVESAMHRLSGLFMAVEIGNKVKWLPWNLRQSDFVPNVVNETLQILSDTRQTLNRSIDEAVDSALNHISGLFKVVENGKQPSAADAGMVGEVAPRGKPVVLLFVTYLLVVFSVFMHGNSVHVADSTHLMHGDFTLGNLAHVKFTHGSFTHGSLTQDNLKHGNFK
eukprot:CAMPEP_0196656170 /NCGR_PEP_ID=MMETSP1086-20130531/13634_1 /TAXON_ID=77921 /ORGANISM="Cyanoptyche  gloeocystis , Strain SAG4.97" /LENGTH=251 /DNA_ID=CAMNT_0041988799 /DNA_START=58 /DNA_END=809 /DNA_ORIENTATION=+